MFCLLPDIRSLAARAEGAEGALYIPGATLRYA